MRPTLIERDHIFVNRFLYRFTEPKRGDIIVFKYPEDPKRDFVKRLMAFSGEKVIISDGRVFIDGKKLDEPLIFNQIYYYNRGLYGQEQREILVPEDSFFVLGDNSASSRDSRYWGFVPKKYLIGKVFLIWWPPSRIRAAK